MSKAPLQGMTDKAYRAQRKRILALMNKWRTVLGLDGWDITMLFHRGPYEVNGSANARAMGSASVDWEYLQATLEFNLWLIEAQNDRVTEECFVHECLHILVREMRQDWACNDVALTLPHEERVATTISRALIEARKVAV